MQCYMMSPTRAKALAEALRKMYPKRRKKIDADAVRIYCVSNAEADADPTDSEWLDRGPLGEVAAWIDIDKLLR
jgi:hypothetical protein